jgi:hypothetical protein
VPKTEKWESPQKVTKNCFLNEFGGLGLRRESKERERERGQINKTISGESYFKKYIYQGRGGSGEKEKVERTETSRELAEELLFTVQ